MQLKHIRPVFTFVGVFVLAIAVLVMVSQTFKRQVPSIVTPEAETTKPYKLTSSAFTAGSAMPALYTCQGENVSPPLTIENPPENTAEFVLVARDSNDTGQDKVHWIVWNIPKATKQIAERILPSGAIQGTTDDNKTGYAGPCPTDTALAHYTFELYAINDHITLDPKATYDTVVAAMNGKVIASTILIGTALTKTP